MDSIIKAEKVNKSYGKGENYFSALKDINLDIKASQTIAIVGKSGSGKSTLMHILAFLDQPDKGQVLYEGIDYHQLKSRKLDELRNKKYGFVFQQFFLNPHQTVLENVVLPLKIANIGRGQRKKRGLEVLTSVNLLEKANSKTINLSGGQKQRVAIARALINDPEVIFADEPTGNLDSVTGKTIEDLLFSLNKEKGITLIIVTHDEDLAKRCMRQISITDGKIVGSQS